MAGGSGGGGFLGDVNDPWLKPRLLRALVTERLPQPGGAAAELSPTEVASILEAVRTHGLLTEDLPARGAPASPKLAEAWRAAVDAWVEGVVVARCASTVAELEGARRAFERRPRAHDFVQI